MNYKEGDKVVYLGEVATITKIGLGLDVNNLKDGYCIIDNSYIDEIRLLEPYKTAHDKLIELGYSFHRRSDYIEYTGNTHVITFRYGECWIEDFSGHPEWFGLTISNIITQYLEEWQDV